MSRLSISSSFLVYCHLRCSLDGNLVKSCLRRSKTNQHQLAACALQHRAPHIRRDRATLQEYKNAQQLTDRVPIKEIPREPPMSRLRTRRPFVIEAARLANLNQTEQETWEQWIQGVPPGHDLVTNPTCPQPGFTLPRRPFVTLNRLRCGQARCAESIHRWGVIASPACPCGESHQTTRHIVEACPLTAFPGGLRRLHQAGPDAVGWLSRLSMKL